MKFSEFMKLPGKGTTKIVDIIFGNDDKQFNPGTNKTYKEVVKAGLIGTIFGTLAGSVIGMSQAFSKFVRDHETVINTSFWSSVGIAAGAAIAGAVMAAFFPAALATVVGFSVMGYSIASLAGANVVAQVAVGAGLAAAATTAATFAVSAVVDVFTFLAKCCAPKAKVKFNPSFQSAFMMDTSFSSSSTSASALSGLGASVPSNSADNEISKGNDSNDSNDSNNSHKNNNSVCASKDADDTNKMTI